MYLQHFGLREEPFGATPDPRFLYLSSTHREALASLEYRIRAGCGFIALVSVPGMGKTTLLFQFLQSLRTRAETAFIFQTQCDSRELLRQVLSELNWGTECGNDLVAILNQFKQGMLRTATAGKRVVIVIDEAQNLTPAVLESVRLLSNFETPRAKLVQIVLSGQPALAKTLNRPELSQLRQRITIGNVLKPLSPFDVQGYVDHRLRVAGYSGEGLFSSSAIRSLAEGSRGIPRIINNISFNALSMSYALDRRQITKMVIEEVLADLEMSSKLKEYDRMSEGPDIAGFSGVESRENDVLSTEDASLRETFTRPTETAAKPDLVTNLYSDPFTEEIKEFRSAAPGSDNDGFPAGHDETDRFSPEFSSVSPTPPEKFPTEMDDLENRLPLIHAKSVWSVLRSHAVVLASILFVALLIFVISRYQSRRSYPATVAASAKELPAPTATDVPNEQQLVSSAHPRAPSGDAHPDTGVKGHSHKVEDITVPLDDVPLPRRLEPIEVPAPGIQTLASSEKLSALPINMSKPATAPAAIQSTHGAFEPARLLRSESLKYPPVARAAHIDGQVTVRATISTTGKVQHVSLIRGPMMLATPTLQSVKNWEYAPATLDGKPVVSETTLTVKYNLDPVGGR